MDRRTRMIQWINGFKEADINAIRAAGLRGAKAGKKLKESDDVNARRAVRGKKKKNVTRGKGR